MNITELYRIIEQKERHINYLEKQNKELIVKNIDLQEQLTIPVVSRSLPSDYDIGLINDYGGGNVEWWQDYLKEEVARCNNYWVSQLQDED